MLPLQTPPKSLCILRLSAIGDITHTLPVLRTLQHYWPETAITWIIGKTEATLVDHINGVEFVVFDKTKGLPAYRELGRLLKGRGFDLLLHMQVSFRASLCSLAVRAPIRLGFDRGRAKNLQWLFTNARIAAIPRQHVLDGFLEFTKALGLEPAILRWNLPIPEAARDFASNQMPDGKKFLAINACTSNRIRNFRNWSIDSYAAVIDHAHARHGLHTVLTGGPTTEEKEYAAAISAATRHPVLNLVGKTTLKQLAAVLARAKVVIAPDTGPAHIANVVGTPVIGLFATSNPERTGPYLCRAISVNRYPDAVQAQFGKTPEDIPWGKRVRTPGAMDLITVEEVTGQLDKVFLLFPEGLSSKECPGLSNT
jgi:heptosyltransferase I